VTVGHPGREREFRQIEINSRLADLEATEGLTERIEEVVLGKFVDRHPSNLYRLPRKGVR
jgi:hypothetical protein